MTIQIHKTLSQAIAHNAIDLFLVAGKRPYIKCLCQSRFISDKELLSEEIVSAINQLLSTDALDSANPGNRSVFSGWCVINSKTVPLRSTKSGKSGSLKAVIRIYDTEPRIDILNEFPDSLKTIIEQKRSGLVIYSGPHGSGITTSLTAISRYISNRRPCRLGLLSDEHNSIYNRQINPVQFDAPFQVLLQYFESMDVLIVDTRLTPPQFRQLLRFTRASRCLVFCRVNGFGVVSTLDILISPLIPIPDGLSNQDLLSDVLVAAVWQQRASDNQKNSMVINEVLIGTQAVKNLIQEGHLHHLYHVMDAEDSNAMYTQDQCLIDKIRGGSLSFNDAKLLSRDSIHFERVYYEKNQKQ